MGTELCMATACVGILLSGWLLLCVRLLLCVGLLRYAGLLLV